MLKSYFLEELVQICVAILATLVMGAFVGKFLNAITKNIKPPVPGNIKLEDWEDVYRRAPDTKWYQITATTWLGMLERFISLMAFWKEEYTIIGGWLAFKVAAKWEVWKNVVQVPNTIDEPKIPQLSYLKSRNSWGAWLLMRFLIGTLLNVLIGAVAAFLGKNIDYIIG